jgi:hypothetical protein
MNKAQKDKLFEIFEKEIIDDSYTRVLGPFIFRIYTSNDSKKIVIECHSNDKLVRFYTIDYEKQQYLPECNGINGDEEKFFLNCEMEQYPPKIFYTLNEALTTEFNNRYKAV